MGNNIAINVSKENIELLHCNEIYNEYIDNII